MPKTVLFDLDDTILDFHKSEAAALTAALTAMQIPVNGEITELYSRINDSMWKRLEKGELTRPQIQIMRFEKLFDMLSVKKDAFVAKTLYEKALSEQCFFTDGARELLPRLYGSYRLYIVSNGTAHVQDGRIKASGIAKYFQDIFISDKIGVNKPSKEFFDYCARHISDYDAKRTIIVGDSPTSDILGGKNAGIATCRFNPHRKENPSNAVPDYEITQLSELPKILETFFRQW